MRRWLRSGAGAAAAAVVALALAGLVPAAPAGASAARSGAASCRPLGVVGTPSPGSYDDLLVGALSAADVWAVGATYPAAREVDATLIEHWDGTAWRVVPSPPLSSGSGILRTVAGDSPSDVWAVGTSYADSHGGTGTLIEHWNGSRWSVVPSPSPGLDGTLSSVSAVSGSDIWAVGCYFSNTGGGSLVLTLAEHFDGTRWTVVPTPSPDVHDTLAAVQAAGHGDVWAVGGSSAPSAELVEHWDGTRWRVAAEPYRGGNANYLYALAGSRSPGVWAAGSFAGRNGETLAEHFCRA